MPNDEEYLLKQMYDEDFHLPPRVPTEIKLVLTIFTSLLLASYLTFHLHPATETYHEPTTQTLAARAC